MSISNQINVIPNSIYLYLIFNFMSISNQINVIPNSIYVIFNFMS
jgi:hypothetical protein